MPEPILPGRRRKRAGGGFHFAWTSYGLPDLSALWTITAVNLEYKGNLFGRIATRREKRRMSCANSGAKGLTFTRRAKLPTKSARSVTTDAGHRGVKETSQTTRRIVRAARCSLLRTRGPAKEVGAVYMACSAKGVRRWPPMVNGKQYIVWPQRRAHSANTSLNTLPSTGEQ